ncbi:MAG: dihydroorotate dehydrogenase (quinone) [Candidatus Margulisiibacteriota bacterium]
MENRVSDYTVGFEGEPEIHFILNSQGFSWIIKLWEGYFSAIMDPIETGPNGWTGLALPYHTLSGWNKDEKWQIPNLTEVIEQLSNIEPKRFHDPSHRILLEIIDLLSLARKNNQPVFIRRD